MKSSAKKIELASYDELFTTQEERDDMKREKVQNIPIEEIDDFPDHPFKVRNDESMGKLVDSIQENGVLPAPSGMVIRNFLFPPSHT